MLRNTHVVILSLCLGYVIFLLFEAPFISMAKGLKFSKEDKKIENNIEKNKSN